MTPHQFEDSREHFKDDVNYNPDMQSFDWSNTETEGQAKAQAMKTEKISKRVNKAAADSHNANQ